ncbi:M48 family metallopeptidase [Litorisediminicola beolgyonensis]|uniref:M48 family metallopeptidase n=1 Tax=Litorisediminicola beolgyonensis TaxID=1173614 RepID=A0ABW3ZLB5_9RHOB
MTLRGAYFDGVCPVPHPVAISLDREHGILVMELSDGSRERWPLERIREVPDQAATEGLALRLVGGRTRRLYLPERSLLADLPMPFRRSSAISAKRLTVWLLGALTAVLLVILVIVPQLSNRLADAIPPKGEAALGAMSSRHIIDALATTSGGEITECTNADGRAALDHLTRELTRGIALPSELSVRILRSDQRNAFALPGGHILMLRGVLDLAETPEEFAGVLAHEIGHVYSRDGVREALRSAGTVGILTVVLGDFAGGAVVLLLTDRLIAARHSKSTEIRADVFAEAVLRRQGLGPKPMIDMFQRLLDTSGQLEGPLAYFLSHPQPAERIAVLRERPSATVPRDTPLLSDAEWRALQAICD